MSLIEKIAVAVAKADAKEGCTDILLGSESYMEKARHIAQAALTAIMDAGDGVQEAAAAAERARIVAWLREGMSQGAKMPKAIADAIERGKV